MEALVDDAERLSLRAPELALVLGERAAMLAESTGSDELWVRAESSVVHALVTLGHRASTVARAVAALRSAEHAGHDTIAARLRTDLAVCARSLGTPLTGLAALRPVLGVGGLSSIERATALTQLVGCLGTLGRKAELDRVILEGDRLVASDERLDDDGKLLGRALLRVGASGHRRRHRDLVGAADAARMGIGFLDRLGDPAADPGRARVRLVLELVCSLLDRGDADPALEIAEPILATPERAASVAPSAWLRLAIATRVHAQRGEMDAAGCLLRDAVHSATRHGLHPLAARLWLELATIEEQVGVPSEAIRCLRNARAAEHKAARVRSQARALLVGEFGSGEQAPVDLAEIAGSASGAAASPSGQVAMSARVQAVEQVPSERAGTNGATVNGAHEAVTNGAPEARGTSTSPRFTDSEQRETPMTSYDEAPRSAESERAKVVLPMLRLAPEPVEPGDDVAEETAPTVGEPVSDEPVSPVSQVMTTAEARQDVEWDSGPRSRAEAVLEPEPPESGSTPDVPVATEASRHVPTAPNQGERARTRHDSEHGSVAARSVLDRLGISTGGGGGRRRAGDGGSDSLPAWGSPGVSEPRDDAEAVLSSPATSSAASDAGDATDSGRTNGHHDGGEGMVAGEAGSTAEARAETSPVDDFWLPRLSLPPSLAPLEDLGGDQAPSEPVASPAPASEPMASVPEPADLPTSDVPLDDPPPDAGLADLLARALAEHQAGSRSASALVKQLGVDEPEGARRANGRRHRDP